MGSNDFVSHIYLQSNDWPEDYREDAISKIAIHSERRIARVVGEKDVLWATGSVKRTEDRGVSLSAVVFTDAFVVTDSVSAVANGGVPRGGATRVIPWTELSGLTLHEFHEPGYGSQVESAQFTVTFGDESSFLITDSKYEGRAAGLVFLDFVLAKLASK
ncbi:hypothetical protein AB4Y87_23415 [Paenarthrobacter sp. RAF54_2]|uniref:hypothetical protein n=1 Tax=Paenarthrobacter sp. RAF54_2 TaxID=3233061 RepID=UPI003F9C6AA6